MNKTTFRKFLTFDLIAAVAILLLTLFITTMSVPDTDPFKPTLDWILNNKWFLYLACVCMIIISVLESIARIKADDK